MRCSSSRSEGPIAQTQPKEPLSPPLPPTLSSEVTTTLPNPPNLSLHANSTGCNSGVSAKVRTATPRELEDFKGVMYADGCGLEDEIMDRVRKPEGKLVVAEVGGAVVGYMALSAFRDVGVAGNHVLVILWVSVRFRFRGNGIATSLVESAQRIGPLNRCVVVDVQKDVPGSMFKRLGFRSPTVSAHSVYHKGGFLRWWCPTENLLGPCDGVPPPPCVVDREVLLRFSVPSDEQNVESFAWVASKHELDSDEQKAISRSSFCVIAHRPGDPDVLGLVAANNDGRINFVGCAVELRKQGLGTFLLFLGLDYIRSKGHHRAVLSPLKGKGNYYLKRGFIQERGGKRRRNLSQLFRPLQADEALLWRRAPFSSFVLTTPNLGGNK